MSDINPHLSEQKYPVAKKANNWPNRAWTCNPLINSQMLYHWAMSQNKAHTEVWDFSKILIRLRFLT